MPYFPSTKRDQPCEKSFNSPERNRKFKIKVKLRQQQQRFFGEPFAKKVFQSISSIKTFYILFLSFETKNPENFVEANNEKLVT